MGFIDKLKDKITGVITPPPVIRATMMGPRAVGKTTLMASIFSDTRDSVAGTGVYFRPTPETGKELTKKKLQLQSIISNRKCIADTPATGAIEATSTETTFSFEMGKVGRSHSVNIEIKDFPGEYLLSHPDRVSQFVKESHIIMIAIDSPYLMEENGRYNEQKNDIATVFSFLESNPEAIKDKMILLVPLKCERYFHDSRLDELKSKVKVAYESIISLSKEMNVACAITPIQTLGHVEFDKFVDNTMGGGTLSKLSQFRYYGKDPRFMPMFCVQPLYYLLTYVANQYEWLIKQPTGIINRLMNTIGSYLKDDDEFFPEIKKMGANIIHDQNGYELLVPNTILKLK